MTTKAIAGSWSTTILVLAGACGGSQSAGGDDAGPDSAPDNQGTIVLDGEIGDAEWSSAPALDPEASFDLRLISGESIFIAVGAPSIFPHVCVFDGQTVRILHASASLGTGHYEGSQDSWTRTRDFSFVARDADPPEIRESDRAGHKAAEGWLGTTVAMGTPGQTEIEIVPGSLPVTRMAVAILTASGPRVWPPGVGDGCADAGILMGSLPATAAFDPSSWAPI